MAIRAEYDGEADALYVWLNDRPVARTAEVGDAYAVDLDADDVVVGFEVLSPARNRHLAQLAERFGFVAEYPAVLRAVDEATVQTAVVANSTVPSYTVSVASSIAAIGGGTLSLGNVRRIDELDAVPADQTDLVPAGE